jgi:hypothetical protein
VIPLVVMTNAIGCAIFNAQPSRACEASITG